MIHTHLDSLAEQPHHAPCGQEVRLAVQVQGRLPFTRRARALSGSGSGRGRLINRGSGAYVFEDAAHYVGGGDALSAGDGQVLPCSDIIIIIIITNTGVDITVINYIMISNVIRIREHV